MPIELAFKLPMYGQSADAPFSDCIELAQAGEAAGFSAVYVIDHLSLPPDRLIGKSDADPAKPYFIDAWCTLSAIAACTSRIKIGPQVTPIGLRNPVFIAKWGATIDRISNGRLKLGLGLGHREAEYLNHGLPYPPFRERYDAMIEGVEIIRALWSDPEPFSYEGAHYTIKDVDFWPKPIQEHVPFWFGGASRAIQRAVAKYGDGWFPAAPQQDGFGASGADFYRDSLTFIRDEAKALGRTDRIGSGALFLTTISEDQADIDRAVSMLQRRPEYAGKTLEEINEQAAFIIGKPDDVCRLLQPYIEAGVEELTVSFHPLDDMEGIRRGLDLYARKVIPYFA